MFSKFTSVVALATFALVSAGSVSSAATIGVSDVGGSWTALLPPTGPTNVTGLNTNAVSWGTPYQGAGGSGKQSGYSFVGAAAGNIETGTDFDLGTFTHNNFVINKGTSITGAGLSIAVNLMVGGVSKAVTAAFNFSHDETSNKGEANGVCKNGGANYSGVNSGGCADRVSILDNAASKQTFDIDGFQYILDITGFTVGGQFFTEFWTTENAANSAILKARFTLVGPVPGQPGPIPTPGPTPIPVPAPVPLPAAGWLMLAGLGALAAARARRKA